ncbi:GGDEF domain-containing protein [Photobacterium damselae subsp. damselae]|uniref:sensor domain-containing diguanylate cyclase n=1 Tax=Photobacterium damselae TaxID=38293 RepID=UPI00083AEE96|nr:sensor domain-containing diguanylate cyclase [Photobacterium damselae]QSH56367.1 GGDEF domain-containing protein [Photobacterium damselae subsp. damselae]
MTLAQKIQLSITRHIFLAFFTILTPLFSIWMYKVIINGKELVHGNLTTAYNHISSLVTEQTDLLDALASDPILINKHIPFNYKETLLTPYQNSFDLEVLAITDCKGNIYSKKDGQNRNIYHRDYFQQALKTNQLTMSELLYSNVSKSHVYILCKPLKSNIGMIISSISLDEVSTILNTMLDDSIYNVLINYDGDIISHAYDQNKVHLNIFKKNSFTFDQIDTRKIALGQRVGGYSIDENSALTYSLYTPLKNTPWVLVSKINYNKYLMDEAAVFFISLFIGLFVSGIFAYKLRTNIFSITKPVDNFIEDSRLFLPQSSDDNLINHLNDIMNISRDGMYCSRTHVLNRKYFLLHGNFLMQEHKTRYALLFIDLDNLKQINDNLGHKYGDDVISCFAHQIRTTFDHPDDLIGRYGGDEFIVLTSNFKTTAQLTDKVSQLINQVSGSISNGQHKIDFSTSIGIALNTKANETIITMINHADKAVYQSKREGKACYRFYQDPDILVR